MKFRFLLVTTLAIISLSTIPFSALAQSSGSYTFGNGQNYTANIVLTGDVVYTVNYGHTATVSGVISGNFNIIKSGTGKLIFSGVNTYSGTTTVSAGTLQTGNGTSGSIQETSSVTIASDATLRFEPGSDMFFSKIITGQGNVEFKGENYKYLFLTADNDYAGTTTIESGSILHLGYASATGSVTGNIINNGELVFDRSDSYSFGGNISGTGHVTHGGTGNLTLSGTISHTGETGINRGSLILSASTNLESSSGVTFTGNNAKLDVSSGDKTIKNLNSGTFTSTEVILGTRTLTIGSYETSNDGGGIFSGIITGTNGNLIKNGMLTLHLWGENTYSGTSTVNGGAIRVGNYSTGALASHVVLNDNTYIVFDRSNTYNFTKNISGDGFVYVFGGRTGELTLSGTLTYTGPTYVYSSLKIGATTSLENSRKISCANYGKLDFSSGNKTFKELTVSASSEIILGDKTLTIGTSSTSDDGGGYIFGKITGTNFNVVKQGTETFTEYSDKTAAGTLTLKSGTLHILNWQGNFVQNAGTLGIFTAINIGGDLTLNGGTIEMDLTKSSPAKLVVGGTCTSTGTTTITLSPSVAPAGQVLIEAASGIDASKFALVNTGQSSKLTSTGTQLLLSTTTVGIETVAGKGLQVYPNPTKGQLTVDNGQLTIDNVEVFDVYGKKIANCQPSIVNSIDISHLPAGIYFVKTGGKAVKVIKE